MHEGQKEGEAAKSTDRIYELIGRSNDVTITGILN